MHTYTHTLIHMYTTHNAHYIHVLMPTHATHINTHTYSYTRTHRPQRSSMVSTSASTRKVSPNVKASVASPSVLCPHAPHHEGGPFPSACKVCMSVRVCQQLQ